MKVKDLIEKLKEFDQEKEVIFEVDGNEICYEHNYTKFEEVSVFEDSYWEYNEEYTRDQDYADDYYTYVVLDEFGYDYDSNLTDDEVNLTDDEVKRRIDMNKKKAVWITLN